MSAPKALAICTTAIGDTLLCVPALCALGEKYDLDVLVHRNRRPLLIGNPYLARLYPYRNNFFYRLGLILHMEKDFYQRVVILHANDGIKKLLPRLRYEKALNLQGWNDPKLNLHPYDIPPELHVVDKRLALAVLAGAKPINAPMRMYLGQGELDRGKQWLDEHCPGSGPVVAFCPGAAQVYKCWPADRFGQVAGGLAKGGARLVVVGSKEEEGLAGNMAKAAGREICQALGLDLRLMAAVLAHADLLITNDTGPMHVAQAVGTRVLALFGPTDHLTIGPRDPHSRVLKASGTCEPCTTKSCEDPHCMEALEVGEVLAVAWDMLGLAGGTA